MHPILIQIGPLTLYTYGLMVASGFLIGISWASRMARKEGVDPQKVYDASFWIVIAGILGARITYILLNLDHYLQSPLDAFKLWQGGLVFYGGFIGAAIAVRLVVKRYDLDLWTFADILAPGVALGHAVGRLGCFYAGCCYGAPTDVSWAVTFTNIDSIAPLGVALHPTQLYSSAGEFTLFILLTLIRPYRKFKGQIFLTWVGLYAIVRSTIEHFRDDPRGLWFDGMISTSQIIGAIAFTTAVWLFFRNKKRYPMNRPDTE